jgi:class 3 adenylate cyclase/predicted ATPase
MRCTACGTENEPGSRFCDECGAPMAAACPTCRQPVRAGARFCRNCGTSLTDEAPAPAATETTRATSANERRLVSVLFADLVGFTTLAEDRDPESTRDLLTKYFDAARDAIERHGGTIEKFIGDAVMAVWGTPIAHEDDAERAVRAGLELVDAIPAIHADLRARAGVLTGEAAVNLEAGNQGMVAGDLVNTAARLQGVAEPGTVLVGEATMRAAERSVVFEPVGERTLKGKTSPVPAWQAIRVVAQRGGQGRTDGLEPPFVGRDEELRQLKEALHATGREERVRLVSITGPAGIGKSRLVWELEKYVDGISERVRWHRGRSPSYGEGITFWALGEMVRRRAGLTEEDDDEATREGIERTLDEFVTDASERERIGPALLTLLGLEDAPAGGREALFPAWRTFFERVAETGTTVLVFEDLQWADAGLLDFIDHLLDWSRGLPIMVVSLARPELFDRRPDWAANRRHLTSLALDPLADDAMRDLLAGLVPGLPADAEAAIIGRAEGMPLYAVETVRGLLSAGKIAREGDVYVPTGDLSTIAVPETLRSLIASRLDALEPADRALVQDAAVLGQVFTAEALAAVSGASAEEVGERLQGLVRRELLDIERDPASPERGQHKFVQSLIREVAYGTLARRDRRARHLAVARHFEAIGDAELAGALASHYVAAHAASEEGPEADAVATQARIALSAAASRAMTLASPDQALAFLDQALALTTDVADRQELLAAAANSARFAARPEAVDYAEAAVEAARTLGDPVALARSTAGLGEQLMDTTEMDRAREVLTDALTQAREAGAVEVEAEAHALLSRVHMRTNRSEESIAAADAALTIAEPRDLEDTVTEALINKGTAMGTMGRIREGCALLELAVERADAARNATQIMRARNNLAITLGEIDPPRASQILRESLEIGREYGERGSYNWMIGSLSFALLFEGSGWDEAMALVRENLEMTYTRIDRVRLRGILAMFEVQRGEQLDTIVPELREIVGSDATDDEEFFVAHHMAMTALFKGDFDLAYRRSIEALAVDQDQEFSLIYALRAAAWGRNLEQMRDVRDRLAEVPVRGPFPKALRTEVTAAIAALEGRPTEAVQGFRDARDAWRKISLRLMAAWTILDAITLLPGEPEVRSWADEARAAFEAVGAAPALGFLDAALAAAPARASEPSAASVPVE